MLLYQALFGYEWEQSKSPAGATQWTPKDGAASYAVLDAHDPSKRHPHVMLNTDIAFRTDPIYEPISRRFLENPKAFEDAFARAWFKLTHRDMGPISRYLGPLVPAEQLIWQDPVPVASLELVGSEEIATLQKTILATGLCISQLVSTAWASASTFRATDKRGGANGARIALEPQCTWEVNSLTELAEVLKLLEVIQSKFNVGKKQISLADLIVLGGCAATEEAARNVGQEIQVPFTRATLIHLKSRLKARMDLNICSPS